MTYQLDDELFNMSPELKVSVTRIIKNLSRRYSRYLSPTALYTQADLEQEGWMCWWKLRTERRYDPQRSQITTLFYTCFTRKLNSILKYEGMRRRRHERCELPEQSKLPATHPSPERYMMLFQAIEAVADINSGLARMLIDGVPKELLTEARVAGRLRAARCGGSAVDAAVTITPKMIRHFFKINLNKFRQLANNYL